MDYTPFSYVGIFYNETATVFLGVTPTLQLLELQTEVHKIANKYAEEVQPYSRPGDIVFHCTLATSIIMEAVPRVIEICQGYKLPKRCRIESIDVVEYFPAERLVSLEL